MKKLLRILTYSAVFAITLLIVSGDHYVQAQSAAPTTQQEINALLQRLTSLMSRLSTLPPGEAAREMQAIQQALAALQARLGGTAPAPSPSPTPPLPSPTPTPPSHMPPPPSSSPPPPGPTNPCSSLDHIQCLRTAGCRLGTVSGALACIIEPGGRTPDTTPPIPANYPACRKFLFDILDREATRMIQGNTAVKEISVDAQCRGKIIFHRSCGNPRQTSLTYEYIPTHTRESWLPALASHGLDPARYVFLWLATFQGVVGSDHKLPGDAYLYINSTALYNAYVFNFVRNNPVAIAERARNAAPSAVPVAQLPDPGVLAKTYATSEPSCPASAPAQCTTRIQCADGSAPGSSGCTGIGYDIQTTCPNEPAAGTACRTTYGARQNECYVNRNSNYLLPDGRCNYSDLEDGQAGSVSCGMAGSGQRCNNTPGQVRNGPVSNPNSCY